MTEDEEDRRRRAYAIWEREGRPEGRDAEHWARAGQTEALARHMRQVDADWKTFCAALSDHVGLATGK